MSASQPNTRPAAGERLDVRIICIRVCGALLIAAAGVLVSNIKDVGSLVLC